MKRYYEWFMELTVRKLVRKYKYKKRLKELRKKDQPIYPFW